MNTPHGGPTRVIVVGGGVTGLTVAYRLLALGRAERVPLALHLLEADGRAGGHAWTTREDGFLVEAGPNGFLEREREPELRNLVDELGLAAETIEAGPRAKRRWIYRRGKLRLVPSDPRSLFTSDVLSPMGKLRLLLEPWAHKAPENREETVHDFAARRIGREAADALVDAAVSGISAGDSHALSAASAFPAMLELERKHGSLIRAALREKKGPLPRLRSFRGGMSALPDALRARLGCSVSVRSSVESLARAQDEWRLGVRGSDGDATTMTGDHVVLALPAWRAAKIVIGVDGALAQALAEIPFAGVAVVALAYREADLRSDLDGYGYMVDSREKMDSLGVLWDSSVFEGRAPAGCALVRVLLGGWRQPRVVDLAESELIARARAEIELVTKESAPPIRAWVRRWPGAIAQYTVGHEARLSIARSRLAALRGLELCGTSYDGISVGSGVTSAERCARRVFDAIRNEPRGAAARTGLEQRAGTSPVPV